MNYDELISLLNLEEHTKIIKDSQITSVKLNKSTRTLSVFFVVPKTWEYKVYNYFIKKLSDYTKLKVELRFMATSTEISVSDIRSYIHDYVNYNPQGKLFNEAYPEFVNNNIVCKFNSNDLPQAYRLQNDVSRYLKALGINYQLIVEENKIKTETQPVNKNLSNSNNLANNFYQKNNWSGRKLPDAYEYRKINELNEEMDAIQIRCKIFNIEEVEKRLDKKLIMSYYATDYTNSIVVKCFEGRTFERDFLKSIKNGDDLYINGNVKYDNYAKELVMMADSIIKKTVFEKREDNAEFKRIELHAHTKMSDMDGVCDAADLIKQAASFGHKAIAITDHLNVQAYPTAQATWSKIVKDNPDFKVIYGIEMNMIDPILDIVLRPNNSLLSEIEYCIFDIETTGLSARYDDIIEFGCVIMKKGEVIDRHDFFVKPSIDIPDFIAEKTSINNETVKDAMTIQAALIKIREILGDRVLVAHNAKFDVGFINSKLLENGYSEITNPVVDTLDFARSLLKERRSYSLKHICNYYKVPYDDISAHRADFDAEVLSQTFFLMLRDVRKLNVETLIDLQNFQDIDAFKKVRGKHITILVKNSAGLKDLFKLVSYSNTDYLATLGKGGGEETAAEPRIPRAKIQEFRENLLIGTSCQNSEIFEIAMNKTRSELIEALKFYDYVEIQPLDNYVNLIARHAIHDEKRLHDIIMGLIEAAESLGMLIVASGDVHYINPEDKIFRDVYIDTQGIGGVRHPLYVYDDSIRLNNPNPDQHFRTTQEMLEAFSFLGDKKAFEYVVENPNKIYDMIDVVKPIHDKLFTPSLEGDEENLKRICYEKAHSMYGEVLPEIVEKRLEKELNSIIGNGFTVIYYVAHLLVKKSNDDGYIVGSRGSVGSSFVATMSNITEVNPLPPHYYCPHCQYNEWITDGSVASGFDLEDKPCPKCSTIMKGDGQDIPFETFLGFEGDKVPDIDLNFSGEYQANAHAYTKELFGEDHVFRAGTIGGVAEKTAFGYVNKFFENQNKFDIRRAEKLRLATGCQDVKRTTGQHPGGIIVIPQDYDVYDFTPTQCPANNPNTEWLTSHFDFHAIHDNVLKLDILGHVDPTALKMFERISGIDPKTIPMNDKDVISLFSSTQALCIDSTNYTETTGATGLPEFGTPFVRGMLKATNPTSFAELVQISGLSHGTDVWLNNAQKLIDDGTCVLKDVIGCRDDIMVYLLQHDLPPKTAFTIMESVRKGKGLKEEWKQIMREHNVPEYYIESCLKIKYMFPKAHAVAYVLSALRIAWFKVHYPHYYYAVYFTTRCDAYDLKIMTTNSTTIKRTIDGINMRLNDKEAKKEVTNKEIALITTLEVCLEMYLRGYSMSIIDLELSYAREFRVHPDNERVIIPPFSVLDGLGGSVADTIVEARNQQPFLSQEDMLIRTSISKTSIKLLEDLGTLEGLQKENQMSLF